MICSLCVQEVSAFSLKDVMLGNPCSGFVTGRGYMLSAHASLWTSGVGLLGLQKA